MSDLPWIRAASNDAPGACSKCGRVEFQTSMGIGRLYWWRGVGPVVRLDGPTGTRIDLPVLCVHCKTEHEAKIVLPPPPPSQMTGGG